jgi:two-component system response regulator RegA
MRATLERVLIIEDDRALSAAIARTVVTWAAVPTEASTIEEGLRLAGEHPDLVILDVRLPDGTALDFVRKAMQLCPAPAIVAISGQASAEEAFELAKEGVRAYLPKPFSLLELTQQVEHALNDPPHVEPLVAGWVGQIPLRDVQNDVRRVMVDQALGKAKGSRSGAARLLYVTRQAVQQALRLRRLSDPPPNTRETTGSTERATPRLKKQDGGKT